MNNNPIIEHPSSPVINIQREKHYDDDEAESLNKYINPDNNEELERILSIELETDNEDMEKLNDFCNSVITKKFKESIKQNKVLHHTSDNKSYNLKIFESTNPEDIKTKILKTINHPDKTITNFIKSSIDLMVIDKMEHLERNTTSLQNKRFHKIKFSADYHRKIFGKNYYLIIIDLLSVNFL
jgi:ATP-dependent 26S proteasome regulatory subunit